MKHLLRFMTLLVGCVLLWSCSSGSASAIPPNTSIQAAPPANVEETIIALEHKWAEAIVSRDMGALNELIADDFTGATDVASMLVRGGMRTVQLIGVPQAPQGDAAQAPRADAAGDHDPAQDPLPAL